MPTVVVKEPKAIIMDLMGTAVKTGFIEKILLPYVKDNVSTYLAEKWSDKRVKKDIEKLRKEATDGPVKIAAADAPEEEQKKSVAEYMVTAVDTKKESSGVQAFRFNMWFDGYKKGKIKTPIYSDVAIQVKKWKDSGLKIYVLSNGWKEATKKFLGTTTTGDLNLMVDDHFDTTEGKLDDKQTYTNIAQKIGLTVDQCLFLTKSGPEGLAAKQAGMPTVLVMTHRKNIDKLTDEERTLNKIRSFNELEFGDKPTPPPTEQTNEGTAGGQKSDEQKGGSNEGSPNE